MIDTGATISCVPENGEIMRYARNRVEKANLAIKLADGSSGYIDKKIRVHMRPAGSRSKPVQVSLYVQNNIYDIFGYQALLGLRQLKLFDLEIAMNNGKVYIYHQDKLIGNESPTLSSVSATVQVIDNISVKASDNDIKTLLCRFKKAFRDLDASPIKGHPMRILTVHQRPIFAKQRRYDLEEIKEMKEHIENLLKKDIIEPSNSGYAANSRIIRKKNGQGRLVINYIPLNAATYRDSYCLPNISDILAAIQGKRYFSSLDCTQGFYQIEVDKRDRHKTAFSSPIGNFQWKRCPFGARNSCAEFQSAMNRIFREGLFTRCVIYVDDILVFGNTREEHNRNLEWVLQRCVENDVKLKIEKCSFLQHEVEYLGFLISSNTIKPIPSKIESLRSTKPPRDKTELRSIIGKLNFYSRFVPNYSKGLECLRGLLIKDKDFQWRESHQKTLETLISKLNQVETQYLVSSDSNKIIVLVVHPDSLEAILLSEDERLIMRTSRLLSTAEANYSFIEKQLLALVLAMNKFQVLMQPNRFKVRAPNGDVNKVLKQIHRPDRVENLLLRLPPGFDDICIEVDPKLPSNDAKKKPFHVADEIFYVDGACRNNGKPNCRASWAVCAEYDRQLELKGYVQDSPSNQSAELEAAIEACKLAKQRNYRSITIITDSKYLYSAATLWIDKWKNNEWRDNKNKPVINTKKFEELLHAKDGLDIEWCHVKGHSDNIGNNRADMLARSLLDQKSATLYALSDDSSSLQNEDPEVEDIKKLINRGMLHEMEIINNVVYFIDRKLPEASQHRIYVPKRARHWLLTLAHDDQMYGGHLGIRKTFRKLIRFYWPRMHQEVESYVKSCDLCQKFKSPSGMPPGYLHSIPVSKIFEHIHIDIVGPLHTTYTGHKYVITATDAFSKWAFAAPSQNVRTQELISFVEQNILSIHGKPKRIITDRGTQFTSKEWQSFIEKLGVEHKLTSPYHPQSNGIDERLNGTLMRILRNYVDEYQERWDEHLKWSVYAYNTTMHESTGYSPYQILFGSDSRSPLKPTSTTSQSEVTDSSRESIRTEVNERNKAAQDLQKKYYDRHRQPCNLYVGQLVYIRVNTFPTWLSKKFHINWDGPVVIISLIGDKDNPRAVTIFDYDNLTKKVVSVSDVKPVIDTYKRPATSDLTPQTGGGHTLMQSSASGQEYSDSSYHVILDDDRRNEQKSQTITDQLPKNQHTAVTDDNQKDQDTICRQDQATEDLFNSTTLNLPSKTIHGPISSSPKRRRVTISDTVEEIPPEPNLTDSSSDKQQQSSPKTSTTNNDTTIVQSYASDTDRPSSTSTEIIVDETIQTNDDEATIVNQSSNNTKTSDQNSARNAPSIEQFNDKQSNDTNINVSSQSTLPFKPQIDDPAKDPNYEPSVRPDTPNTTRRDRYNLRPREQAQPQTPIQHKQPQTAQAPRKTLRRKASNEADKVGILVHFNEDQDEDLIRF